jgi:hypothetical protein
VFELLIDFDRDRKRTAGDHSRHLCPYSPCHSAVRREITAGDRFGASLPNSAANASWKSPVEMPRR